MFFNVMKKYSEDFSNYTKIILTLTVLYQQSNRLALLQFTQKNTSLSKILASPGKNNSQISRVGLFFSLQISWPPEHTKLLTHTTGKITVQELYHEARSYLICGCELEAGIQLAETGWLLNMSTAPDKCQGSLANRNS